MKNGTFPYVKAQVKPHGMQTSQKKNPGGYQDMHLETESLSKVQCGRIVKPYIYDL